MFRRFWPFLLVLIPVLEILVLIRLGSAIGFWSTIWLLIAAGFAGMMLLSRAKMTMWEQFAARVAIGQPPTKELARGAWYIAAGILLIFPGVLTDVAALLLFLPPVKKLLSRLPARMITHSMSANGRRVVDFGFGGYPPQSPPPAPPSTTSKVFDEDVVDARFTEYRK